MLTHFLLTFYRDKLIEICATSVHSVENEDFEYAFEAKYGPYDAIIDHYYDDDDNVCKATRYQLDAFWNTVDRDILVYWHTDGWCCDSKKEPEWTSYSEFSISNNRHVEEMLANCTIKK